MSLHSTPLQKNVDGRHFFHDIYQILNSFRVLNLGTKSSPTPSL